MSESETYVQVRLTGTSSGVRIVTETLKTRYRAQETGQRRKCNKDNSDQVSSEFVIPHIAIDWDDYRKLFVISDDKGLRCWFDKPDREIDHHSFSPGFASQKRLDLLMKQALDMTVDVQYKSLAVCCFFPLKKLSQEKNQ